MQLRSLNSGGGSLSNHHAFSIALLVAVSLLAVGLFAGGAAAHPDAADLVVHNQTQVLDEHDEVHTITVDSATADTEFYIDVHGEQGDLNATGTFEAGTTVENLALQLDPTITNDTTVTVATHAANGTELEAQEIRVDVVEAPTVEFDDQTHALDEHDEVHTITVDTVAANQEYYVDVHSEDGNHNKTATFEAGTAQTDLNLNLDPTLKNETNVTVAVHAANGTELAATTATVTTADVTFTNQTQVLDEHDEVHTITVEEATAEVPFYVDFHAEQGDLNATDTFEADTTLENATLDLDPTLTETTEVTVAVHAEDGTELSASTATVTVEAD
ncbi:MAG: hypothetical protein ACI80F_001360, partial [Natronomonas sp.]|uniref:hypothetical protein n=1 Tax=Natronomonas sp. TaxID=2184060 RepID=UPI003988A7A1